MPYGIVGQGDYGQRYALDNIDRQTDLTEEKQTAEDTVPVPSEKDKKTTGTPITYTADAGTPIGGGLEPRLDTGGPSPTTPGGDTDVVRDQPTDTDIFRSPLTQPPVDDNLTGAAARELGQEPSLGSAGKAALARTARGDIDVSELQARIRTQQAAGGLGRGGAAAKQEARIVGRYKQSRQMGAAARLADLTRAESETEQRIQEFLATTEGTTAKTALSQLMSPISTYGNLLGGSQAGLASIYGLGRLL